MRKHYTIPLFIPHEGCLFECVFCAQRKISGRSRGIPIPAIQRTIRKYLLTFPKEGARREVAFFGGSFTGLTPARQEAYLDAVRPFIRNGSIDGIRVSTRPDYIDAEGLKLLKRFGVTTVELGVQSMADDVLKKTRRGHNALDTARASRLIRKNGLVLGHQIMVGLPGSTPAKELRTAEAAVRLGAAEARIYPVIVLRGTALAGLWRQGRYKSLTEREAIVRCDRLVSVLRKGGVRILRCGLHPSEGLLSGREILSGPFHQSFGQKVSSYMYGGMIKAFLKNRKRPNSVRRILYNPADGACVIGYRRENAEYAESVIGRQGIFSGSKAVPKGSVMAELTGGAKKTIGRL